MANTAAFNNPWLVAVWPGMGQVAISAGYYLMVKLGAHALAEFTPQGLFDVQHVAVEHGLVQGARLPRSQLFIWNDPAGKHDLIIFIGEAQPPIGKHAFCRALVEHVRGLGVEHVFTFAAMATPMRPEQEARVFAAAADEDTLWRLRRQELEVLDEGYIGGLNGVLMGVAAERGLRGACLLGEIPRIFAQLPSPKASLAVLEAFTSLAGLEIDLTELAQEARTMEEKLAGLLEQVEDAIGDQAGQEPEFEEFIPGAAEEETLSPADKRHIERLFEQAQQDRSKAYELKGELDRLEIFQQYEDRFLDLFKKPE